MKSSSPSTCVVCIAPKLSLISIVCRICYDNDKEESLITPCHCKGTVAFVHRSCLERWLAESNTTMCELCHVVFKTERSPKYPSTQSIWKWFKAQNNMGAAGRGLKSDIIACTIITPIAIIITYVCLFSSDYYNQQKFSLIPAARWTSVSLLIMIGIMLIGYYLWVYSVIRLHARTWYNWWQRECVVRFIPPSSGHVCDHFISDTITPNNTPIECLNNEDDEENSQTDEVALNGDISNGEVTETNETQPVVIAIPPDYINYDDKGSSS